MRYVLVSYGKVFLEVGIEIGDEFFFGEFCREVGGYIFILV